MTNKEKAREFMRLHAHDDHRCQMLVMFLGAMFMMTAEQVLTNIKSIAEE